MTIMKRLLPLLFLPLSVSAQAPAESEDVMLQGFYWDSQKQTGWTLLTQDAEKIAKDFTLIWLPPSSGGESSTTPGGNDVGYHPRQWNSQNSCWGTSDQLKTLIATFREKGVKVIADIVINHRAGDTDWGNFTADDFGTYGSYQLTADHICSTDEMNTDPNAGKWNGTAKGAADSGENWGGARDLDHSSAYVQADCKAYLEFLKGDYGYEGWRYDFVKGFDGKYVGLYNEASAPYLSVGEYWDGAYDKVAAWIESTGRRSMAFDFPMKYDALNNGLAKGDYSKMSWIEDGTTWRPAGMIHHHNYNRYAVTFVDNHDTYRDGNKYTGSVAQAYAFLLSSPGVPCVFYPHWKGADRVPISLMIAARRAAGVHSQSDVTVKVRSAYYESLSVGKRGNLITRIGISAPTGVPEGYQLACKGTGWAMFLSDNVASTAEKTKTDETRITVKNGRLTIDNPKGDSVTLYDTAGHARLNSSETHLSPALPRGTYLVHTNGETVKCCVR